MLLDKNLMFSQASTEMLAPTIQGRQKIIRLIQRQKDLGNYLKTLGGDETAFFFDINLLLLVTIMWCFLPNYNMFFI